MGTPNAQFLGQIVFNLLLMIVLAVLLAIWWRFGGGYWQPG